MLTRFLDFHQFAIQKETIDLMGLSFEGIFIKLLAMMFLYFCVVLILETCISKAKL